MARRLREVAPERISLIRSLEQFISGSAQKVWGPSCRAVWMREDGQTFVEYALLLAFVAAVALVAVQLLGTDVSSLFSHAANTF